MPAPEEHPYECQMFYYLEEIPPTAIPASRPNKTNPISPPISPIPSKTWSKFCAKLPLQVKDDLNEYLHLLDQDIASIWQQLQNNELILMSDGSVSKNFGTYGWIIGDVHGRRIVKLSGNVYGWRPSSFRAEVSSLQALLHFLYSLEQYFDEPNHIRATVHIDNQSVVDISKALQKQLHTDDPIQDLLDLEKELLTEEFRDKILNVKYDAL
mmetsp:Transcript_24570/g.37357  ORF Transcript_24570/g.37357 Transcript_24570/m.37357 type:complete len:211 (+) Transcript_24570:1751-2383(+)|eukprot:CAMPEP_0178931048 /NCGR_PEP_ID=MMETSP0786-20121207/21666_1 /TAXON_ID=186022 /ORGANISM="Thalassionema frauenfeldii, Strain CCMP 1798" /LENGTH=210 /DNA_ID=CAMNT_0020607827 /DNA_START=1624 /DNA_END=2256 /DNA_ORIENTATION=-